MYMSAHVLWTNYGKITINCEACRAIYLFSQKNPRRYFFCGSFMFLFCLELAMSLCTSIYMCLVVTCWERADLLALVCGV